MDINHNISVQSLNSNWYNKKVAGVDMLRLDKVHPIVSGNKWFKLKYNIQACRQQGHDTILTFGGGYSNHLIATAFAAKEANLKSIGIIRGEELGERPSATLKQCEEYGMQLHYVTRGQYKERYEKVWQNELSESYDAFVVPEGGANNFGVKGAAEMLEPVQNIEQYTHVLLAAGTGTSLAGVRNVLPENIQVWGFVPMKGGAYIHEQIKEYTEEGLPFRIYDDWHLGGFGKYNEELIDFMNEFYHMNTIPLDVVYTGKMMFAVNEMLNANAFNTSDKLLCIHTGGLQGNSSAAYLLHY